ncbi:hypothetical protein GQ54DRAFT_299915 [Martensiomyces pterosporus]|nr:hypothetical protein GQ54DRAFT_299915 [Martensiomyces pterosporus]
MHVNWLALSRLRWAPEFRSSAKQPSLADQKAGQARRWRCGDPWPRGTHCEAPLIRAYACSHSQARCLANWDAKRAPLERSTPAPNRLQLGSTALEQQTSGCFFCFEQCHRFIAPSLALQKPNRCKEAGAGRLANGKADRVCGVAIHTRKRPTALLSHSPNG